MRPEWVISVLIESEYFSRKPGTETEHDVTRAYTYMTKNCVCIITTRASWVCGKILVIPLCGTEVQDVYLPQIEN